MRTVSLAVSPQWVDSHLAAIGQQGVEFRSDPNMAKRRFITYSVATWLIAVLAAVIGISQQYYIAIVIGAVAGVGFQIFWLINYGKERQISRVLLSPMGVIHDRWGNGAWQRQWAYRWCEIASVDAKIRRINTRTYDMGTQFILHNGSAVAFPDLTFGLNSLSGRALLQQAHHRFLEFSRR